MSNKNKAANPDYVPFGKLVAWQMRPISLGAVTIITMYLSLYCTDTLGMPAALVGTLLMASKIFDGVTDIFAGWLIDNTNTKWCKARPYELSIIGVWICMFALFSTSDTWSMTVKSAWIFIMYTLIFSIFSTLLNAAETPYIIRAFKTPLAVTKVSAYGGIIVTLGSMVISVSFPILVGTMGNSTAGWRKLIAMYAIPLVCLGLLRFLFVMTDWNSYDTADIPAAVQAGNCWMTPGSEDNTYVDKIAAGVNAGIIDEKRLRNNVKYMLNVIRKRTENVGN